MADRHVDPALRGWGRPLAAFVGALLVAWLAARLLAPSEAQLLPVDEVVPTDFFTGEEVERGRDYRRPQTLIGLGPLAAEVALLAYLAARPARLPRRPALAGAVLAIALAVVGLPFAIVARARAIDVGLSTDSWLAWAGDVALSTAIAAALAAILAAVALALIRRFPRGWWIPGSGLVVVAAAALTFATPLLLDPLFNDFRPLRDEALRSDVLRLAERAGVQIDDVEVIDASRRTTAANAYVTGLGATKKVVIYDNVLEDFPRAEARSILAHELGHERYGDLPRGLLYVALVAPLGVLAIALLGGRRPSLPRLALALVVVSTSITWVSNGLSREVEQRADAFALRLTGDPKAFTALHRRLAERNVSDPDPPALRHALLGTHPSTVERLGMARGFGATMPP